MTVLPLTATEGAGRLILVVDDDEDTLTALDRLLTRFGYRVRTTDNGYSALRMAEDLRPDLVLLDVMMPDIDGFRVCHLLKSVGETKDIPIIFMSAAYGDVNTLMEARDLGAFDFIIRPVPHEELLLRIRKFFLMQQRAVNAKVKTKTRELLRGKPVVPDDDENNATGHFPPPQPDDWRDPPMPRS